MKTIFELEDKGYAIPFVKVGLKENTYHLDMFFSHCGHMNRPILTAYKLDPTHRGLYDFLKVFFNDEETKKRYIETIKDQKAWSKIIKLLGEK